MNQSSLKASNADQIGFACGLHCGWDLDDESKNRLASGCFRRAENHDVSRVWRTGRRNRNVVERDVVIEGKTTKRHRDHSPDSVCPPPRPFLSLRGSNSLHAHFLLRQTFKLLTCPHHRRPPTMSKRPLASDGCRQVAFTDENS